MYRNKKQISVVNMKYFHTNEKSHCIEFQFIIEKLLRPSN